MNTDVNNKNRILFEKITEHLMNDENPSEYLNDLLNLEDLKEYPYQLLKKLTTTEQSKKHHPEGSVWNHTMLVIDEAAKVRKESRNPKAFMWAALLHDIGKPATTRTRKERITSYDHDVEGEKVCIDFLRAISIEDEFIEEVAALVRYHMHMLYVLQNLPYQDKKGLYQRVNAKELALLCRCDRLGRGGVDREKENNQYREFLSVLEEKV